MTREIFRDRTLDGIERFLDGRGFKISCWVLVGLAGVYFVARVLAARGGF